jgi:hypothetical protein
MNILTPQFFEAIMLVCFGCAWPISIYKTLKIKKSIGKSMIFLFIILAGYIAGILHEVFGEINYVIYFYLINTLMVIIDIMLTAKYRELNLPK